MDNKLCNLIEKCETPEAPLCPMLAESLTHGIWYPNEAVCRAQKFQNLPWLKNQRRIASLKLNMDDGYFTIRMLSSLPPAAITIKLKGADPCYPDAEFMWFQQRSRKQTSTPQKKHRAKAARVDNLQLQLC
jgi:hypothetical protein